MNESDRFVFLMRFLSFLFTVFGSLLLLASFSKLPPVIPIFYSRPWGDKLLGSKFYLIALPILGVVSFFVNYILSNIFAKNDIFLARTVLIFTVVVNFIVMFGTVKIISLLV
ncbi:MAG TPA: hypothetical protein VLE91_03435 [Candidatus Saccharimonadales bacterium]|nr:hypothetical protein [Candidatus Saccharimonadales bacterium]